MLIKGIGASGGRVFGHSFLYQKQHPADTTQHIPETLVSSQMQLLEQAVETVTKRCQQKCNLLLLEGKQTEYEILSIQISMLADPQFIAGLKERMGERYTAQAAVQLETDQLQAFFASQEDKYFQDRVTDIKDIAQQLIAQIRGEPLFKLPASGTYVLIGQDIPPSVLTSAEAGRVVGIALVGGGKTSHTSILANTYQIPAIVGCGEELLLLQNGQSVYLDGEQGVVEFDFTLQREEALKQEIEEYQKEQELLKPFRKPPTLTKDLCKIGLKANALDGNCGKQLLAVGAEGIGLFRSEFIFFNRADLPTEEEQMAIYAGLLGQLAPYPVTIRTLDIGADKSPDSIRLAKEVNPFLGKRGIRLAKEHHQILQTQLRACLRAAVKGKLQIMFPMVSCAEEVSLIKELLQEASASLTRDGIPHTSQLPIGIMVEVPAAALLSSQLAKDFDFFSIGTNDLTQYTLAVDRLNQGVSQLYDSYSPGVLKLIQITAQAARENGIPCSVCGEMASEIAAIPLLLGYGITQLSVSASQIPRIRRFISQIKLEEAEKLAKAALECYSSQQVHNLVSAYYPGIQ